MDTEQALITELELNPTDLTLQDALIDLLLERDREEGWQRTLDAVPDCHRIRKQFGRWLEGRGDIRGLGYQALSDCGKLAIRIVMEESREVLFVIGIGTNSADLPERYKIACIDSDWYKRTSGHCDESLSVWKYYTSREDADNAAARAFLKLPPERQTELLQSAVHC